MIEIRHPQMETSAATRAAYKELYGHQGIQQRDSFYLWLLDLLKPKPGTRLVDISCGQGRLVAFARARGVEAVGIDFAEEAIQKAKSACGNAAWAVGDGEQLPFAAALVDYVTHIGSLEHYQHPEAGMREIARLLKPQGTACVLLPNAFGLFGNIQHVWHKGDVFDDGQPLQRYHTRAGWHEMLVANGLEPIRTVRYERERPRTWADVGWYLLRPAKVARLLLANLVPLNLANCLVYLCRRRDDARVG